MQHSHCQQLDSLGSNSPRSRFDLDSTFFSFHARSTCSLQMQFRSCRLPAPPGISGVPPGQNGQTTPTPTATTSHTGKELRKASEHMMGWMGSELRLVLRRDPGLALVTSWNNSWNGEMQQCQASSHTGPADMAWRTAASPGYRGGKIT